MAPRKKTKTTKRATRGRTTATKRPKTTKRRKMTRRATTRVEAAAPKRVPAVGGIPLQPASVP